MRTISNRKLALADILGSDADWGTIGGFALTFDGYKIHGSFEKCAEIANNQRQDSLTDARTCLFFEQLRWRHFGDDPDEETMRYIRSVVELIRSFVAVGDIT